MNVNGTKVRKLKIIKDGSTYYCRKAKLSTGQIVFGELTLQLQLEDRYAYILAKGVHFYIYAAGVSAKIIGDSSVIQALKSPITITINAQGGKFKEFSGFTAHTYTIRVDKNNLSANVSWDSQGKKEMYIPPRYTIAKDSGLGISSISISATDYSNTIQINRNANDAPYKEYPFPPPPIDAVVYSTRNLDIAI